MDFKRFARKELELGLYRKADLFLLRLVIAIALLSIVGGLAYGHELVSFSGAIGLSACSFGNYFLVRKRELKKYVWLAILTFTTLLLIYCFDGNPQANYVYYLILPILSYYLDRRLIIIPTFIALVHSQSLYLGQLLDSDLLMGYKELFYGQGEFEFWLLFLTDVLIILAGFICFQVIAFLKSSQLKNIRAELDREEEQRKITKKEAYSKALSDGNFDLEIRFANDDQLGQALYEMGKNLKKAKEREAQERYVNQGVSKLNDTIRVGSGSLQGLCDEVMKTVVEITEAVQGTLYLNEKNGDEEAVLRSKALYAFDTPKLHNREILPGEGLVGQAFLEKAPIYLLDIPQNYVSITSGLGETNPDCIYVKPLIFNEDIAGVLELAFFGALPDYKKELIDRSSEYLATALLNEMRNEEFRAMFQQSQEQNEVMKAQEEELRQNMEELTSTQEEMERKNHELNQELSDAVKRANKDKEFYKNELQQKEQEIQMLRGFIEQLQNQ